jgi:uncharacterized protein YegP (UPF0339 family)
VTKFIRCAALVAAIAALVSAAGPSPAPAQDKKKEVKASKDDAGGSVVLSTDTKGMYRFKVVGADGKTIMQSSKGYDKKDDALKALDTVKSILSKSKVTEAKDDGEDEPKKDVKKDAKKKDGDKK